MFAKLTGPFKEFGLFAGIAYVLDRILSRLPGQMRLYFYELMVQPIPKEPLVPPKFVKHMEFRLIEEGDPEVALMPAREDIKAARFEQDVICFGAYKKGDLIGYIWFAFNHYDEDEVRARFEIQPADASVFDFDLYLFEAYRMGFSFVGMWDGASRFLRERGVRYTFSRLTRFNTASRRAHDHLGWKRIGRALFLKLWSVEIMFSDLKPWCHVSLGEAGRVPIALTPKTLELADDAATESEQLS